MKINKKIEEGIIFQMNKNFIIGFEWQRYGIKLNGLYTDIIDR